MASSPLIGFLLERDRSAFFLLVLAVVGDFFDDDEAAFFLGVADSGRNWTSSSV